MAERKIINTVDLLGAEQHHILNHQINELVWFSVPLDPDTFVSGYTNMCNCSLVNSCL